ncbi:AAA family ATPase [Isoptericola croceus]|uniref:AAA family ATPase n=1 Tax=Isoptericola croceus TaxID=3031406 RepID=UPI0023F79158|nr:AAA family ATPase [Isoptericola croceus]
MHAKTLPTPGFARPTAPRSAAPTVEAAVASDEPRPLTPGSTLAQAMYETWSGRPVTVIDSPPGAGKSTLIGDLVCHLYRRTDLTIAVGAFTREAAVAVAGRIAALVGPNVVRLGIRSWPVERLPAGVLPSSGDRSLDTLGRGTILVNTLASLARLMPRKDVLIVDEAYQATFELVSGAAEDCEQVVLVGDPGQIGPVVTANTSAWDQMPAAPHMRAPEVFSQRDDAMRLSLPRTYRLGQLTVDAIAPLYDISFASARPDRRLRGRDEIEAVTIPPTSDPYSASTAALVARRAADLIGVEIIEGDQVSGTTTALDVAVVVSHNAQQSAVEAHLSAMGVAGVAVGTADRLQGGQWHAVVALDPLVGKDGVSTHALATGRLCVMASRHLTHLTWIHDGQWVETLRQTDDLDVEEVAKGVAVREALCAHEPW